LTVCDIVFLRKSTGSLDLLTEARVAQRLPRLRSDLSALYGAYYVAELLADWTEDYDPHPILFDEALDALRALGLDGGGEPGLRVMRFELIFLREIGYGPALERCAGCGGTIGEMGWPSARQPGEWCAVDVNRCSANARALSARGLALLRTLAATDESWRRSADRAVRGEVRQIFGSLCDLTSAATSRGCCLIWGDER